MVLEIIIARLDIIAKLGQVVIALEKERVYEINKILLLKLEKNRRKERDFAFFQYFLLITRVKATSLVFSILIAILTLEEDTRIKSGILIVLIASTRVRKSG